MIIFSSRPNAWNILFSIKILKYISMNHLAALVCHKAEMNPINLGVGSLMPLKRQIYIYDISKGLHEKPNICLPSPL
jgi:hypothetical protein